MKKIYFTSAFALLLMCLPALVSVCVAQPNPPTGPPCWPPPCIPVDGGISLMVVAGIAYGGKKLYDSKKQSETTKAE